jgi:AcrR family transcriptional regulator
MLPKPAATPRKLPKQERSQATVEAILTATTRILNRVAELAGVSIGSLYQYFPNKEALISAVAEHHANKMLQLAQHHLEEIEDNSISNVLRQIVRAALAAHAVNPRLHRVLHEQIPRSQERRKLDEANTEKMLRSFLAKRCDQLQPQNLDLTAFMIRCTIEAIIYRAVLDRPEFLKNGELEQELMILLTSYLVKRRSADSDEDR